MQMEALQTRGAVADRPKSWHQLFARPGHFAGVFQQQVAPCLVQLLDHHFVMSELQIVGCRFWVAEKGVGGLDVISVKEHLWNAPIRVGRHRSSNSNGTSISPGITQIYLAEMLLCPSGWVFLMCCLNVQGVVHLPFAGRLNFSVKFRAKIWVMTSAEAGGFFGISVMGYLFGAWWSPNCSPIAPQLLFDMPANQQRGCGHNAPPSSAPGGM